MENHGGVFAFILPLPPLTRSPLPKGEGMPLPALRATLPNGEGMGNGLPRQCEHWLAMT